MHELVVLLAVPHYHYVVTAAAHEVSDGIDGWIRIDGWIGGWMDGRIDRLMDV